MDKIPILNLNEFKNDNHNTKLDFVQKIGESFENIGFVTIKNHGIKNELLRNIYAQVEKFFNLETNTKKKYEIYGLSGQRGYVPFGKEHAKNNNQGDLKEFWHFGQELETEKLNILNYPKNIIVDELSEFNNIGNKVFLELENLGRVLLQAISIYLNLDEFYFDNKILNGNSILRPIHYPPITKEPKNAVRAAEHEDINLITLLIGASAEGLEVLNKNKKWIKIDTQSNEIVVNVGDMLQRLTNNKLKSTTHKVVNPPKHQWSKSRYSIPFFLHPHSNVSLKCLNSCIDKNTPKSYNDITAGEYLNERIKELGLNKT
ncbi:MAG: flavonol synthase [Flavobacteriales bacterium]|nr:flavonol synthase [Flavobacteriales bacterium]|tara:strand:- start:518 stop:1468 length:951 start_codon:yes stop_codon:yes gene_type:complete